MLSRKRGLPQFKFLAISTCALLVILNGCGKEPAVPTTTADLKVPNASAEALAKCDALASHPHDPGRYAAGVVDEQLAPGAAIDACETATKLNSQHPRALFELGRAYWAAQRDTEAFASFVQSAQLNYAPAMKYIGDAYLEGRGLPPGEQQDGTTALKWYQQAADGGFKDAALAIQEVNAAVARRSQQELENREAASKNTFNASYFQNPTYMSRIYNNNFKDITPRLFFIEYMKAFTSEMGGDKLLYIDSACQPLVTELTSTALGAEGFLAKVDILMRFDKKEMLWNVGGGIYSKYATDQGKRDAVILVNRYGCKNPVAQRIMKNLTFEYKDMSDPTKALQQLQEIRGDHGSAQEYAAKLQKVFPNASAKMQNSHLADSLTRLKNSTPGLNEYINKAAQAAQQANQQQ